MVKIYALVSGQLVLYVGKTTNLKHREWQHRYRGNTCSSKDIPSYIDWSIKILEEVPNEQATSKEQYYYDTLKPLYNKQRPKQSLKEYQQTDAFKHALLKYRNGIDYNKYHREYRLRKKQG